MLTMFGLALTSLVWLGACERKQSNGQEEIAIGSRVRSVRSLKVSGAPGFHKTAALLEDHQRIPAAIENVYMVIRAHGDGCRLLECESMRDGGPSNDRLKNGA